MTNEFENKKVLIIEDDDALRKVLKDKFTLEGFDVLEAKNGEEGLENANSLHPDIILLDIVMPKMDGLTLMKKLRAQNEWGKNVPIIMLTNLGADDEKINWAIAENEPAYYLVKADYSINDLVDKVKERLSRRI
ncbi:response regulator [Candidatus Nomurabacteria bacterium]|nr:response regulator [Candidatus Nomurabacteria bacterium]